MTSKLSRNNEDTEKVSLMLVNQTTLNDFFDEYIVIDGEW